MPPTLAKRDAEVQSSSEGEESREPGSALPSVGSAQHGTGSCQPCAWFWKPQGCLNGAACLRCHLCPAGEIKRRKGELKQKKAEAAGAAGPEIPAAESTAGAAACGGPTVPPPSAAPCLDLTEEGLPPAPSWTASDPALPSIGSRLHGSGQCKPCAWFWKAEGCRNESACGHCHLCPMGEAKARKQAKLAIIRAKTQGRTEGILPSETETRPEQVFQAALGTSEVRPIAVLAPQALLFNVCEVAPQLGQPLQPLPLFPGQPVQPAQVQPVQQVQAAPSAQPVRPVQPGQPVHATAAWVKCPTGQESHGCAYFSQPGQMPQRPVLLGNPLSSLSAFQSAQSLGKCEAGERRLAPELAFPGILPSVPLYHQPVHPPLAPHAPFAPHAPHAQAPPPLPLPSVGSALHAEGKCSPCAWFWKPQGCRHGANCGRCHLCPAGEIKQRKKSKATAKEVGRDPIAEAQPGLKPWLHGRCA